MVDMPKTVMLEIRARIVRYLDENDYMSAGRQRSGEIMDALVSDPSIGSKIAEYRGKERVRTYIKDAVLNRYTKERTKAPDNWVPIMKELYGVDCVGVGQTKYLRLFRSQDGKIFLASHGRLIKWETALRKLLEHRAANAKALNEYGTSLECCLILMSGGAPQTAADTDLLKRALETINVKVKLL